MNETASNTGSQDDSDDVGRLIRHVGARDAVPAERMERARANVRAHWESVVADRQAETRPSRWRLYAIAASLVLVVGVTLTLQPQIGRPGAVATVNRVVGPVSIEGQPAESVSQLSADASVVTGEAGRVGLHLAGGQSLRIDSDSRVTIHNANHVTLESGALYIDTAYAANAEPILVATPLGSATDVGTQFQVRLTASTLVVGVRDGMVRVEQDQRSLAVESGRSVELGADGTSAERSLNIDDPSWRWIEAVAPAFELQDASLKQYLEWYANERGLTIVWANMVSRTNAGKTLLSGSISGATLDEGIRLVALIAPFEYRIDGDRLWVSVE